MMKVAYLFLEEKPVTDITLLKNLLGGKGAGLSEMTSIGLPVPPGFTITTEACTQYYEDGKVISEEIRKQILEYIPTLEELTGKKFGNPKNPLLVSVRSGARASMPGMMDTVLNLGVNDKVVEGLVLLTGNPRFAYDSYRRFIQMFSDVVMEIPKTEFEIIIDRMKKQKGIILDTEFTAEDLQEMIELFKNFYERQKGSTFPQDPIVQLFAAIEAVFRSWDNERANVYRRMNDIPYDWGTAVNVQSMVFGNMGITSGTGVAFTRNPSTGERHLYGEFLMNAQGEDVVAGIRTPETIDSLKYVMPEVYKQFVETAGILEAHYKDMQDMEFTIENAKLYMLQTRNGKRTAQAAIKIACDLVDEGVIDSEEAVMLVDPKQLDSLLHPQFDEKALSEAIPIATGLAASPGAACGQVVFTAASAVDWCKQGKPVILVRLETSPEDIAGMESSEGILTVRGGMTSHAAVVARGMGTCCVAGCGVISINEPERFFQIGDVIIKEGDYISLDGSTGNVYNQAIPTVEPTMSEDFERFMSWADSMRTLKVRTNADTPHDAAQAVTFGAEGIGLTRTEHMFFGDDRINAIRKMIVSSTEQQRRLALAELLPYQKEDFIGIYEAMQGRPVTIRLLDPPLHEFLPTEEKDITIIAKSLGIREEELQNVISSLHEFNPMMGHRGCRLSVSFPEITEMQTTAIIQAAIFVNQKHPEYNIVPEIMIPLIGELKELKFVKTTVTQTADRLIQEAGVTLNYMVGTMIEIPRAALTADEIAREAEFFSFGTNDLTQMAFGFSRDDAGKFLVDYYKHKIYEFDPFAKLDQTGVGKLVEMSVQLGKSTRPDIKLGICGEHGGDPSSVEFFHNAGLNYVSCSPFRVPIARLAAAQAAIKEKRAKKI